MSYREGVAGRVANPFHLLQTEQILPSIDLFARQHTRVRTPAVSRREAGEGVRSTPSDLQEGHATAWHGASPAPRQEAAPPAPAWAG